MINLIFVLIFNLSYGQVSQTDAQDLIFVNELKNGGFENGLNSWICDAGITSSVQPWNPISKQFGRNYGRFVFTTTANQKCEQIITVPQVLRSRSCGISVFIRNSAVSTYVIQALDSSNVVLGSTNIINDTVIRKTELEFICPSASTVKFRIVNVPGNIATVELDQASLFIKPQTNQPLVYEGYIRSGSGAQVDIPITNTTAYEELVSSNLSLVSKSFVTLPAQIACQNGASSIGNDCGVNGESIGLTLNFPRMGLFKVCANFSFQLQDNSDIANLRISRTTETNGVTEVVQGTNNILINGDSSNQSDYPFAICEIFNITVTGRQTFRAFGFKGNTANVNISFVEGGVSGVTSRSTWSIIELR
jgi:hypothetical protein